MNVLLVAYDPSLAAANGSEGTLQLRIQAQPSWARILPNVYLVISQLTAAQLRDQLNAGLVNKLLVYTVTNELWAGSSFTPEVTQWLNANWRQS